MSDFISVSQKKIEIYSSSGCKSCSKAKSTLKSQGLIGFQTIDIDEIKRNADCSITLNGIGRLDRIAFTLDHSVPQIYIGEDHIGGYESLLAAISSGDLNNIIGRNGVLLEKPIVEVGDEEECMLNDIFSIVASLINAVVESSAQYSNDVLNNDPDGAEGCTIKSSPTQILELSESLHRQILHLVDMFTTSNGSRVRYEAMKNSSELRRYVRLCSTLQRYRMVDLCAASELTRLSFFANLYNAMIVHANCKFGPVADNPEARTAFFTGKDGNKYNICGYEFSPDDIEHGILRGNNKHPSQPDSVSTFWAQGDPRAALSLSSLDPRIHFILNCGASSCPPIKVLGNDPECALSAAASSYLESETRFTAATQISKAVLSLPKLLLWYRADFGVTITDQIARVSSFLHKDSRLREDLLRLVAESNGNEISFELKYSNYDWSSNQVD